MEYSGILERTDNDIITMSPRNVCTSAQKVPETPTTSRIIKPVIAVMPSPKAQACTTKSNA